MSIAALWGTTFGYSDFGDTLMIETTNGRVCVTGKDTFDYLYFRLSDYVAALKGDCIEYVRYHPDKELEDYPEWFIDVMEEGWLTNDYGTFIFLDGDYGNLAMSPNDVVLRNFRGDIRYMSAEEFGKHYDTLED